MNAINEEIFKLFSENNLKDVELFLKNRPHISMAECKKLVGNHIQTPVTLSVMLNNFKMLEFAHKKGCSLLEGNPLSLAISMENHEMIDYLITHNAKDNNLFTPLINSKQLDAFDYLIKKGLREPRLLETAIILDRPEFMTYILSHQIETIYEVNKRQSNMLTVALEQDNADCIRVLLDFGADPDDIDYERLKTSWYEEVLKEYEEIKKPYMEKRLLEKTLSSQNQSTVKTKAKL